MAARVRISGRLDLEAATLRCPLRLESCCLESEEPVCLDYATASRITLTGCRLAGMTGEMLSADNLDLSCSTLTGPLELVAADITGMVDCHDAQLNGRNKDERALAAERIKAGGVLLDGLIADGTIRLTGAVITGQLSCRNTKVRWRDPIGNTLSADALKAGGVLLDGLSASGAVRLHGADIVGQLSCRDARLNGTDEDGNALAAERMKADAVFLDGLTASGAVRLYGADIAGGLSCRGAQLNDTDLDLNALAAERIKAGVLFLDALTAFGAVRLYGADIAGGLSCHDAKLNGTDSSRNALAADRMKVGSDMLLDGTFTAAGTISLTSVHVGGSVTCAPTELAGEGKVALNAARSQIAGQLKWKPAAPVSGQVNLEGATVGELDDDWSCKRAETNGYWPEYAQLRLDGFTYVSCPAFSGQRICGYFTLLPAHSGTRPGLPAVSGTRAWSGDESDYSGVQSTAQYHLWQTSGSGRRSGRQARSSASHSPIPTEHYHNISLSGRPTALSRVPPAPRRTPPKYSCSRGQNGR
jgi:hypothetical protein